MTSEQEAELAQRRLQNAIAFDGGCVNSAKKVAFIDVLAENERLKEAIRRLADQDATLSVCDGSVTVTMDATLTDAERAAVAWAEDCADSQREWKIGATLRGLLERMEHRQT